MYTIFGKRWIHFDLLHGYKATIFMNELELDMHKEKLEQANKIREDMKKELEVLQARPALTEQDYIELLPEDQKDSAKALYDMQKKVDGERAEEIVAMKNRIKEMGTQVDEADRELQKGYMLTYNNRIKYDFIKNYKIKKTYADKK